jgi:uncharacterized protein (DUF1684 family)
LHADEGGKKLHFVFAYNPKQMVHESALCIDAQHHQPPAVEVGETNVRFWH